MFGMVACAAIAALRAHLEHSEAVRDSLVSTFRDELGVSLEPSALALDLVPPALRLSSVTIGLPADTELYCDRMKLTLAPAPLLRGIAHVTRIEAEGRATLAASAAAISGDVALRLERRGEAGWRGALSGDLEGGGSVALDGTLSADGGRSAALAFERVEIGPLSSLLQADADARSELAGVFSGTLDVELPPGTADPGSAKLVLHAESPRAQISIRDVSVDGPVGIEASSADSRHTNSGSFEVDASAARVEYALGMQKASGTGATLRGRFDWRAGKLALDDLRLSVTAFRGEVGAAGDPQRGADER